MVLDFTSEKLQISSNVLLLDMEEISSQILQKEPHSEPKGRIVTISFKTHCPPAHKYILRRLKYGAKTENEFENSILKTSNKPIFIASFGRALKIIWKAGG